MFESMKLNKLNLWRKCDPRNLPQTGLSPNAQTLDLWTKRGSSEVGETEEGNVIAPRTTEENILRAQAGAKKWVTQSYSSKSQLPNL